MHWSLKLLSYSFCKRYSILLMMPLASSSNKSTGFAADFFCWIQSSNWGASDRNLDKIYLLYAALFELAGLILNTKVSPNENFFSFRPGLFLSILKIVISSSDFSSWKKKPSNGSNAGKWKGMIPKFLSKNANLAAYFL